MGSSFSLLNPSASNRILGNFAGSGRPIREKDGRLVAAIRASILAGKLVKHHESCPEGYVHWVSFEGENYARKASDIASWWINASPEKLTEIAAAAKISPTRAAEIARNIITIHGFVPAGSELTWYKKYASLSGSDEVAAANILKSLGSGKITGSSQHPSGDYFDVHGDAYMGACDSCGGHKIGAAEDLDVSTVRNYANSNRSIAKSQIIEKLVATAEQLLGMSGSGDAGARIKAILAKMPSADKLNVNDRDQATICNKIARAINEVYGNIVIDTSLDATIVCQQVSEILSSLSAGMHTEFLEVYNDVHRALRNLEVLKNAMKEVHDKAKENIREAKSSDLSNKMIVLDDLYERIDAEISRQIQMLSNLLNVHLYPTEKELAGIIRSGKSLPGYIEKIDRANGTKGFGKVISDVLTGLGMTANFALLIDKSLKTVGMTADDYAKEQSLDKLRERITNGMMGKGFTDEELHEYLKAAELLYKNFYRADEIPAALKKGQGETCDVEKTGASHYGSGIYGAAEDDSYDKSPQDKRVENKKKLRELIFNAFYRQLNNIYEQLIVSVVAVSNKIGTEIPISDQLNSFRHALIRLRGVIGMGKNEGRGRNRNIYYALTGYYNDALSRSKREGILGDFDVVAGTVEALMEMPMYSSSRQHWESILLHIKAIHSLVDKFSSEVESKFGRGERTAIKGAYDDSDDYTGGNCCGAYDGGADSDEEDEFEGGFHGGDDDLIKNIHQAPLRRGTTKTIDDAMIEFDYKFRVAQIKENLSKIGPELKNYAEEYEKLNANSVAEVLKREQKIYQALRGKLDGQLTTAAEVSTYDDEMINVDAVKKQKEAAIEFIDWQWDVKKRFWATVEAVDQYMRLFTDGLVNHLEDIREIKSMLDEIEIINDWYEQKTGNMFAGVFDFFPSNMREIGKLEYPSTELRTAVGTEDHYYKSVMKVGAGIAGNPFIVTAPTLGNAARKQCRRALGSLGVLKNLISVFIHIGSRFGGEEIRKKAFMSPSQMYNNLLDYINASAFTQGWEYGLDDELKPDTKYDEPGSIQVYYNPKDDKLTTTPTADHIHLGYRVPPFNDGAGVLKSGFPGAAGEVKTLIDHIQKTPKPMGVNLIAPPTPTERAFLNRLFMLDGNLASTAIFGITREHNGGTAVLDIPAAGGKPAIVALGRAYTDAEAAAVKRADIAKALGNAVTAGVGGADLTTDAYTAKSWATIIRDLITKLPNAAGDLYLAAKQVNYLLNLVDYVNTLPAGETFKHATEGVSNAELFRKHWGIWMRSTAGFGDKPNITLEQFEGPFRFAQEDKFFILVMKSLAAKILTTVGLYDVLERPYEYNGLNPLRMILGGDDSIPKVEAEIVPLYVRLPLLAQFYRRIFGFEGGEDKPNEWGGAKTNWPGREDTDRTVKISLVPDVEGEFAGLIRLIFRKNRYLSVTDYAQPDIYDLIREVNIIHQRMKAKFPQNTIMETIHAFVAEINRRYGVVSKKEREHFFNDEQRRYDYSTETEGFGAGKYEGNMPDMGEYAILPGEENEEAVRPSPAQRILGSSLVLPDAKKYNSRYGILEAHAELVKNFRCAIDNHFKNPSYGMTFNHSLRLAQKKVSVAKTDDEKAKIIVNLMRGDDVYTKVDGAKYLVLHETVIAGLNTLSGLYTMLGSIKALAGALDLLLDKERLTANINEIVAIDALVAGTPGAAIAGGIATTAELRIRIKVYLKTVYKIFDDVIIDAIIDKIIVNDHTTFAADLSDSLNQQVIMKAILDTVLGLSTDFQGLVTCRVSSGDKPRLNIAWGGLRGLIETMFQSVSGFITLLKPYVKEDIMNNLLNKEKPGSLYWLQEQFMDKLIVGRPAKGAQRTEGWYASLDECFEMLNNAYQKLHGNAAALHGDTLSAMIHYNSGAANVAAGYADFGTLELIKYRTNVLEGLHLSGPVGKQTLDLRFAARWNGLYNWDDQIWNIENQSALMGFNQLVAKYLQAFHDPVTNKSYAGAILPVANGVLSNAVASHLKAYPDTAPIKYVRPGKTRSIERNPIDILRTQLGPESLRLFADVVGLFKVVYPAGSTITPLPNVGTRVNGVAWNIWSKLIDTVGLTNMGEIDQLYNDFDAVTTLPSASPTVHATKLLALKDSANADAIFQTLFLINDIPAVVGTGGGATLDALDALQEFVNVITAFDNTAPAYDAAQVFRELINVRSNLAGVADNTGNEFLPQWGHVVLVFPMLNSPLTDNNIELFVCMILAGSNLLSAPRIFGPGGAKTISTLSDTGKKYITDVVSKVPKMYVDPGQGAVLDTVNFDDLHGVIDIGWNTDIAAAPLELDPRLILASNNASQILISSNNLSKTPGGQSPPTGGTPLVNLGDIKDATKVRMDPTKETILYSSLAAVFRSMVSSISPSQQHVYLFDNIADVPLHLKEKMRANAPFFKLLFKKLADRCELLRQIISRGKLDCTRTPPGSQYNPWPYVLQPIKAPTAGNSALFQELLEEIARYCNGFVAVCDQLSREVGDDPKFFEVAQNSIKDYRALHGVNPLMLLSSTMVAFHKYEVAKPEDWSLPVFGSGDAQFKMLYGLRAMFANPSAAPSMESAVGFADLIELYNMSADTAGQIKKQSAEQFLDTMVKLMRFVFEIRHVSGRVQRGISTQAAFVSAVGITSNRGDIKNTGLASLADAVTTTARATTPDTYKNHAIDPVLAIEQTYAEIVQSIESSERDVQIKKIADRVGPTNPGTKHDDRQNLDIQNIIDLNIVPINVHALQRHIPLANLYNYGYSFDRMAVEHFLGSVGDSGKTTALIEKLCDATKLAADFPSDPKMMMVRLLLDPHLQFGEFVDRTGSRLANMDVENAIGMLLGVTEDESISRPKFLSDQVFGKMIFGELVTPAASAVFGGPTRSKHTVGVNDKHLSYPKEDGSYERTTLAAGANNLRAIGRLRFDTKLVRNLIFVVNLFRMVRARLSADLTYTKDVITRAEPITRLALTEFYGHQTKPGPNRGNPRLNDSRYDY